MGIFCLTWFIKRYKLFYQVKLKDFRFVVIDGNNLYGKLHREYKIPWKLGGEYPQFYDKLKSFMQVFIDAGVKPIVLMDGLTEPSTEKKIRENKIWQFKELRKNNGRDSPLLRCQTFIDVILELKKQEKAEIYVAAGEGDRVTAALANSYNSPVLSDDSDFYMFDLKCGMIPLNSLNIATRSCSLYKVDLLLEKFKLYDPKFRLLIPAIHGNDYLPSIKAPSEDNFHQTLQEASNQDFDSYFDHCIGKVQENFRAALLQYSNPSLLSEADFRTSISCDDLPLWVLEAYRVGCFHPFLLNAKRDGLYVAPTVVENIDQESAWLCSKYVRQCMYGLMRIPPDSVITEVIRKASSVDLDEQPTTPIISDPPLSILNFADMTVEKRKLLVLSILTNYKSFPSRLQVMFNGLESKWQLPIASTMYWYHNARSGVTEHLMKALLLCFLSHSSKLEFNVLPKPAECKRSIHALAEWQCVYHDALALNCLVKECFLSTSPALLYSGRWVMSFAACDTKSLQQGSIHAPRLYYQLLELVMFK